MDRENELIKAVTELVKIINGMQDNIGTINECIALLKERIEKLEQLN